MDSRASLTVNNADDATTAVREKEVDVAGSQPTSVGNPVRDTSATRGLFNWLDLDNSAFSLPPLSSPSSDSVLPGRDSYAPLSIPLPAVPARSSSSATTSLIAGDTVRRGSLSPNDGMMQFSSAANDGYAPLPSPTASTFSPRGSSIPSDQQQQYAQPRERQPSSPLLQQSNTAMESPRMYRSASADNFYPSPPLPPVVVAPLSPRHYPQQSFAEQQQSYYDTPTSPGLPSSPFLSAQQAAGVPLPGSPFNSHFPDSPYDRPGTSFSMQGPDPSFRGSYYTDATPSSDASSTRRLMYNSGTPSPRADSSGVATLGYFNASTPSFSSGLKDTNNPHNESSIWGDGDADEKGFYGSLNKGMGLEETARAARKRHRKQPRSKKKWLLVIGGLVAVVVAGAVVALVILKHSRNSNSSNSGSDTSGGSTAAPGPASPTNGKNQSKQLLTGGDGSTVTMANGTTFTYQNSFGGYWVSTPFNDSAQSQSYTPPLNQPWDWSNNKIYGVNIGGWLTLEPFITPALYEPYEHTSSPAIDEWTLSENLGANLRTTLINHYETFITEQDFAQIAGAGLNWVRISLPYWAIETYDGEPFLEGVAWNYFLKAIEWCRKYGLRINLDLHAVPGSQNGWNHSGKYGTIGFLNGAMGLANAQRTQNYIRVLTEFISQPQYENVIPMFGILNEAQDNVITFPVIRSYYLQIYNMIREITGIGKGPVISIHDGFSGNLATWAGFLAGSDRIVLDSHPYLAFTNPNNDPIGTNIENACNGWANMFNTSMQNFGFTYAGEWSQGVNDCGQYLNGVGNGTRYEGTYAPGPSFGSCNSFTDASTFNATFKSQLLDFAYAEMDSFQNWFFWTWKIGVSTVYKRVATPLWSYSLGLQEGYMPTDPRGSRGGCNTMARKYANPPPAQNPFLGNLDSWMTGGAGAGQIAATQLASYSQWPPASLANNPAPSSLNAALLPTYTATGAALTLTASPTPTAGSIQTPVLNSPYYTPVASCSYMNPWSGAGVPQPTAAC